MCSAVVIYGVCSSGTHLPRSPGCPVAGLVGGDGGGHLGNICWVPRKQALAAFELTYLKNELDFIAYCFSDSFFICAFTQQK